MESAQGYAQQGGTLVVTSGLSSTTEVEGSFPGCLVTVSLHAGGAAAIFSDNGITPLANPFVADVSGKWQFYAANNRYDITLSDSLGSGPLSPILISDVLLNDPAGGAGTVNSVFGRAGTIIAQTGDYNVGQVTGAAPLVSPALTGTPTAPTPIAADNTTKLATTAYVTTAILTAGSVVASVFGRTGAVVATTADYNVAQITGAAPLASPSFTGTPIAPTPSFGDNSTRLATTAFVTAAIPAAGVLSFNTRTGAVVPASADYNVAQVTGAAPLASPALTGVPTAPTASIGTATTQLATTQFVQQAGLSPLIFAAVTLTSAQLKALHGTPVTLLAAPGAGFALYPVHIILEYKFVTTAYTINGDSIKFDYGSSGSAFVLSFAEAGFFDQGASQIKFLAGQVANGALTVPSNAAFTIYGNGGTDMTVGDGTAVVYIYYALLTLQ